MSVKTINVSLPDELLKEIDRKAEEEYRSRSELLKEATLMYIQTKDNWQVLQKDLVLRARKQGVKRENDIEKMVDSLRH
ncbi:MAG: ribbon-helix-helix domain-containing protein [Patescibacteria group bacterium]|jgi:metal-responsive CopG/Arc/MetJ family transcriptional regulator